MSLWLCFQDAYARLETAPAGKLLGRSCTAVFISARVLVTCPWWLHMEQMVPLWS